MLVGRALTARAETKGIKADIAIARDLPAMVAGDELRLRAALENLADNAVKFTDRGAVALAANAEPAGKRVRLIFAVSDSGIGLSKQDIARLFKPFDSSKPGGFGIGAYEARELVRAMKGRLDVESHEGLGTRFTVRLPLAHAADLIDSFASEQRAAS